MQGKGKREGWGGCCWWGQWLHMCQQSRSVAAFAEQECYEIREKENGLEESFKRSCMNGETTRVVRALELRPYSFPEWLDFQISLSRTHKRKHREWVNKIKERFIWTLSKKQKLWSFSKWLWHPGWVCACASKGLEIKATMKRWPDNLIPQSWMPSYIGEEKSEVPWPNLGRASLLSLIFALQPCGQICLKDH